MIERKSGFTYLEDGTDSTMWISYAMGVIACIGCGAIFWFLGPNLVFDVDSPEFNPAVFLLPLLAAYGLYSLGRGAYDHARASKFGKSTLEMPQSGPRMGRTFSGKVHGPSVEPDGGQFKVTMRFVETFWIVDRDSKSTPSERDNIRWEESATIDANRHRLEGGLPFTFALPPEKDLRRELKPESGVKATATVHLNIPGVKDKTLTYNALPDKVRWTLEVTAPTRGVDYQAAFGIRVGEPFPVK